MYNCNCNCKLAISRAPTKAKSREPAYSQALVHNKIDRQRVRSIESGRQTVRRLWWMEFGIETGRRYREEDKSVVFVEEQCFKFGMQALWRGSNG